MILKLVLFETLKSKIMKTRLLLFILFAFSFGNAQFNVSEGFESGIIPTGWTTDLIDGVVTHSSSCGGTQSARANFYSNAYAIIYTSSYLSNGQAINISYLTRKQVGAFFGYKYLYYEVNGSGTWNQIANVYSDFSTCTPVNATIAAGVIPSGSTVKFRMQVNRASVNNNNYVYFDDFVAVQQAPLGPQAVAEYNFDNTYNNLNGNTPFSTIPGVTSFTYDRHNNPAGALLVGPTLTGTSASLIAPTGLNSRSVSIWYKTYGYPSGTYPSIFSYGAAAQYQTFGMYLADDGSPIFQGYAYDDGSNFVSANSVTVWHHAVVVFDGTNLKIYIDGALKGSVPRTLLNTATGTNFFIGKGGVSMAFDDLKIYNYVLTDAEVTNLNTNNSLTSENFNANNLEVGLYPNPVNDVLNIDIKDEISSVEIYALQGQKVLSSKENKINVSELPSGIYLVRVVDVNNNIATKKIIKK